MIATNHKPRNCKDGKKQHEDFPSQSSHQEQKVNKINTEQRQDSMLLKPAEEKYYTYLYISQPFVHLYMS